MGVLLPSRNRCGCGRPFKKPKSTKADILRAKRGAAASLLVNGEIAQLRQYQDYLQQALALFGAPVVRTARRALTTAVRCPICGCSVNNGQVVRYSKKLMYMRMSKDRLCVHADCFNNLASNKR